MPLYEYECPTCNSTFDAFRAIADRNKTVCDTCGTPASIIVGTVAIHTFTPYYSKALGRVITSRREKAAYLKQNNLEDASDVDIDTIEKEAKRMKAQEDEIAYKKEEHEFCEKWQEMNG